MINNIKNRIKKILTESQFPKIKIGDIIIFKPDAELTLSYCEGDDCVVPQDWVSRGVWFNDGVGSDGETINVNCGNSPQGAGDWCSNGMIDDIIKVIRIDPTTRKQITIWENKNGKDKV